MLPQMNAMNAIYRLAESTTKENYTVEDRDDIMDFLQNAVIDEDEYLRFRIAGGFMNNTENNNTLVCYDITSDKLRRKIDKHMKDFGARLQFSIFMCRLDTDGIARCREKLLRILTTYRREKEPGDSLIIFERFSPSIADCLLGERIECYSSHNARVVILKEHRD